MLLRSLLLIVSISLLASPLLAATVKTPLSFKPNPAIGEQLKKSKNINMTGSSSSVTTSQTPEPTPLTACKTSDWSPNTSYKLKNNVFMANGSSCFSIMQVSGVVLDCDHHTVINSISGPNSQTNGVLISTAHKITLKNCKISNFDTGVFVGANTSDVLLETNDITNNSSDGIGLGISQADQASVLRVTIKTNHILDNGGPGIDINNAKDVFINTKNTIQNNGVGVSINGSFGAMSIKMDDNLVSNNDTYGIYISASSYNEFKNTMACKNGTLDVLCDGTAAQTVGITGTGNQFSKVQQCAGSDKWPTSMAYTACPFLGF